MKRLYILLSFVYLFSFLSGSVVASAQEVSVPELIRKGIFYYDNNTLTYCADGNFSLSGKDNAEKIWNFFKDPTKDLTDMQVAGIIGNMAIESPGFEPMREQGIFDRTISAAEFKERHPTGGPGWGLVQFTPGSKFIDTIKTISDADLVETQLNFVWTQLQGEGPVPESTKILEQIRSTTTLQDAVLAFQGNTSAGGSFVGYERPADQSGSVPDRLAAAQLALDQFGGKSSSFSGPSDGCVLGSGGGTLTGTVLAYAWPDYTPAPFLDRTPSYADAVSAAKDSGIFVGGTVRGVDGIDCGGFVTLLMINSGFEPAYNSSGKGGNVPIQEAWLKANWTEIFPVTTADHKPGDIAVNDAHIYVYVGEIDNFNSNTASASYSERAEGGRAPMAGSEVAADPNYRWYRKQ